MLKMRFGRTRLSAFVLVATLLATLWLNAGALPLFGGSSGEEALRTRVAQLYAALQQSNWGQAEKFLTKESRDAFRYQAKTPPLGYQIESVKLDPGGSTALVMVRVPTIVPIASHPILAAQRLQWRLVKGTWYLEYSKPDPQAAQALFNQSSHSDSNVPHARLGSSDLKFSSFFVSLGEVTGNEVKIARFPFTNVSKRNVTLGEVQASCECLRFETQQKEYKPGEAGELVFEFDPSSLQGANVQALTLGVRVTTQPENAVTLLNIGAALIPGSKPPEKP